jgi:hypothetical protein
MGAMAAPDQKITFGEMRSSGIRGLLIYCADFKCSHSVAVIADRNPARCVRGYNPKLTSTLRPRGGYAG